MRPTPPPPHPTPPHPLQVYALDVLEPSKPLEDPENPASEAPPLTEGLIASAARMLNSDGFLYIYGRINFSEGLSITQLATKVFVFSPTHPFLPYVAPPTFSQISPCILVFLPARLLCGLATEECAQRQDLPRIHTRR